MASFKYVLFSKFLSFQFLHGSTPFISTQPTSQLFIQSTCSYSNVIQQYSLLFLHNNHSSPHMKNTQLIYHNTNNKNIFYHYIFHKTYTHTILISSKLVFNQAYYIFPKLAIDSKGNKSSTSDYYVKLDYISYSCASYISKS